MASLNLRKFSSDIVNPETLPQSRQIASFGKENA